MVVSANSRNVVFVDGIRTPFGKAGPKGIYAETRADDLVVKAIRELLRRNPQLDPLGSTRSPSPRPRRPATRA